MAFRSGVFTSTSVTVNGDGIPVGNKAITAADFAKRFYHIYGNGISLKPTSAFYVTPKSGLIATVAAGWGMMSGYDFEETTDYDITMTSSTSDQTLYIGVRLDVATGEFTDNHAAARTTFVAATDRVFAIIVIPANAVTLTTAMITDTRYSATYCGTIDAERTALAALAAEYEEQLEALTESGVPNHATLHEPGGSDVAEFVYYGGAQTLNSTEQAQARTNIGAEAYAIATSEKTDNYTVLSTDDRTKLVMNSSSNKTFTFATQAVGGYPDGMVVLLKRKGTGTVTIAGSGGVSFESAGSRMTIAERYGYVYVMKISSDLWEIVGSTL